MHTPTVKRVLGFTFIVLLVMAILTWGVDWKH